MANVLRPSGWLWLLGAAVSAAPAVIIRLGLLSPRLHLSTALFGVGILGAAFLLTWGAEAAERDVSGSIALALLALIAVLPEYAVDMYFAGSAGHRPEYAAYAAANMTGANRLLVGIGWTTVVLLAWLKTGRSRVALARNHGLEVGTLAAATVYSFIIPLKRTIAPFDSLALFGLFAGYLWLAAGSKSDEIELVGPAQLIGRLPRRRRRLVVTVLFSYAAVVILLAAKAFADGLVETGASHGIDRFLLVQWVAPLASEAPEFIAATLLCLRGRAGSGMVLMLASAVNQWTLLVGGLPLAYSVGHGGLASLPLDSRQAGELLLTAAQSLFAVAILMNLSVSVVEVSALLILFCSALVIHQPAARYLIIVTYLLLAAAVFWRQRRETVALGRWWLSGRAEVKREQ